MLNAERDRAYLGSGWKLPLQVSPGGGIALSRHETRVTEAIAFVLGTALGEMPFLSRFGCAVHEALFAPRRPAALAAIAAQVRAALVRHEPRIDVLDVAVEAPSDAPELVIVRLSYRIRANNAVANLVYPFAVGEAG